MTKREFLVSCIVEIVKLRVYSKASMHYSPYRLLDSIINQSPYKDDTQLHNECMRKLRGSWVTKGVE